MRRVRKVFQASGWLGTSLRELLELRRQIRGKRDGLRGTGVGFREAREE